jgi:hypothetical protein
MEENPNIEEIIVKTRRTKTGWVVSGGGKSRAIRNGRYMPVRVWIDEKTDPVLVLCAARGAGYGP